MSKTKGNIGLKSIALFLILAIGLWTASKSMFYHAHIMPDGEIVYHSHPYNKTTDSAPFKSHKHTDAQIAAINHLYVTIFAIIIQFSIVLTIRHFRHTQQKISFTETNIYNTLGRSPPTISFI